MASASPNVTIEDENLEDNTTNNSTHVPDAQRTSSSTSKSSFFRAKSETSTIAHEKTAFEEFKLQVKELCHVLWPESPKEPQGGSNTRILGVLSSRKLSRFRGARSPPKKFLIERMSGGTCNRVTSIKIISADVEDPVRLVLRTPRIIWDASLERDVAILQYLRQHSKIPVPEVKSFDFTVKNPLKSPYVVQSRIPWMPLSTATRSGLSHEGWCTAAKEIGQIILEMQKLSHPHPGIIESSTDDDGVQSFTVEPFDIRSPYDMEWKRKKPDAATKDSLRKDYEKSTLWFIATQLGRWRAKELRIEPTSILWRDHMHRLTDAASAMDRLHCLGHNTNCLSGPEHHSGNFIGQFIVCDWNPNLG